MEKGGITIKKLNEFVKVRFIEYVPKFVYLINTRYGKRHVAVGPFEPEEEILLPKRIADILLKRKRIKCL